MSIKKKDKSVNNPYSSIVMQITLLALVVFSRELFEVF